MSKTQVQICPELLLLLSAVLLILPIQWVTAWLAAVAFHELCHYLVLCLCGCRVFSIRLSLSGAAMETESLTRGKSFFCALAGPIGSLLLLLLARWFPRLALCAFFQSAYNLLPIYPLDGGRALRAAFAKKPAGEKACKILEWCVLILVWVFSLVGSLRLHMGLLPMLFGAILLFRCGKVKIPCKLLSHRLQ